MFTFLATDNIGWINEFAEDLRDFALPFLIVLTAVAGVYAIVLGVKIGISDGTDQRSKAINNMVNLIISFVVVVVLCVIFFSVASYMGTGKVTDWLTQNPIFGNGFQSENNDGSDGSVNNKTISVCFYEISSIKNNNYDVMYEALQSFEIDYLDDKIDNIVISNEDKNFNEIKDITTASKFLNDYIFIDGSAWNTYLIENKKTGDFYFHLDFFDTNYKPENDTNNNRYFLNLLITFYSKNDTSKTVVCNMILYYEF